MLLSDPTVPTDQREREAKIYKTENLRAAQQDSLQGAISPHQKHGVEPCRASPEDTTYQVPLNWEMAGAGRKTRGRGDEQPFTQKL